MQIITASQNETVRKNCSTKKDVFLATFGLSGCVAVLITDKCGNQSLTHADTNTDLAFIQDEIKLMDGEYTIDIIKNKNIENNIALKVISYLEENNLGMAPNTYSTKDTPNGCVIVDEASVLNGTDSLIFPEDEDMLIALAKNSSLKVEVLEYLHSGIYTECGRLNMHLRQLNVLFNFFEETKPYVCFDNNELHPYIPALKNNVAQLLRDVDLNNAEEINNKLEPVWSAAKIQMVLDGKGQFADGQLALMRKTAKTIFALIAEELQDLGVTNIFELYGKIPSSDKSFSPNNARNK